MPTTVNGLGAPISRLPAKPSFDLESAALLDEDTKNMRASVIAKLMMPVPAVSNLRERVDKSCEKIYQEGKPAPETISANYVHIHSWLGYKGGIFQGNDMTQVPSWPKLTNFYDTELPRGTMSPEDTHMASVLHRYKHDASRGSPISPEYEAYYKAHKAAELAFKKKTTLVNRCIEEFQNTHSLQGAAKSDLALLVLNVWQTVAVHDSPAALVPGSDTTTTNGTTAASVGSSSTVAAQREAGVWF
ncbi:hypothetical protein QBC37DRAFT_453924 [Rhypophila decipiens]|uniref:Uncharacterized protein n=1 Tax=Rhypophila decipiens TaxID=261697 RepID=A0AAN6XW92_9PEZI|nr:hypothetical protein QBC37DRAFT_453924 [Rhypophila decipiens]